MELFWKAAAGLLMAAVLSMVLGKDMAAALALAACAMAAVIALEFLEPVLDLLRRLEAMADLNGSMLSVLLKCVGIALVSELSAMVCGDCGSAALGKTLRLLGTAAMLWVSLPLFHSVLNILQELMGEL